MGLGLAFYWDPVGLVGVALSYRQKHLTQMTFGGDFSINNTRVSLDHIYEIYGHHPESVAEP